MPCIAHTLQLVVKAVLRRDKCVVIGKARSLVRRVRHPSIVIERLVAISGETLKACNTTSTGRWNNFEMTSQQIYIYFLYSTCIYDIKTYGYDRILEKSIVENTTLNTFGFERKFPIIGLQRVHVKFENHMKIYNLKGLFGFKESSSCDYNFVHSHSTQKFRLAKCIKWTSLRTEDSYALDVQAASTNFNIQQSNSTFVQIGRNHTQYTCCEMLLFN